jgi:hypothetical protein
MPEIPINPQAKKTNRKERKERSNGGNKVCKIFLGAQGVPRSWD